MFALGPGLLCQHHFGHNRSLKALSIIGKIKLDIRTSIENHNKMINVIMSTWYKIKHKLSHEHNIEHNRSKMRVLQHSIIGKIKPNSVVQYL